MTVTPAAPETPPKLSRRKLRKAKKAEWRAAVAADPGLLRRLADYIPPEGVPISFDIATLGARFGAQFLDFLITYLSVLGLVLLIFWSGAVGWTVAMLLITLAFFFVRVPYYIASELVWNGRTLGKRITKIRVISADGRRLRPQQIVVRNLMKEIEVFTPLSMVFSLSTLGGWGKALALLWVCGVLSVPFFNRRRQRLGDMIAGTLVVDNPRPALLPDLAAQHPARAERFVFQRAHLDVYGRFELQTLEEILRENNHTAARQLEITRVTDAILRKIDYPERIAPQERLDFLRAFYRAQREHLETQRLLGDRRENKFHTRGAPPPR